MSSTGQWEVVGKKYKQQVTGDAKLNKAAKKKFIENAPKLAEVLPLKEMQTLYSNLGDGDQPQITKSLNGPNKKVTSGAKENVAKKQQKKKKEVKTDKHLSPTLEEAFKQIRVEEVATLKTTLQLRFKSSPLIWLKDLVSFFNLKLPIIDSKEPGIPRADDQPLNLMSKEIQEILYEVFEECTEQTLRLFFEHCVINMAHDMAKGMSVVGYKVMVQALALHHPELPLINLRQYLELRSSFENRPPICLSILWAVGQAGVYNLGGGLQVWHELMLPLATTKNYARFCTEYIDTLFSLHSGTVTVRFAVGVKDYLKVMELTFGSSPVAHPFRKSLQNVYPKYKTVVFGKEHTSTQKVFPSFLKHLQPNLPPQLIEELLTCLLTCLIKDHSCFTVWRQLYTKHMVQTRLMLQHIVCNWDELKPALPRSLLDQTIEEFEITNTEICKKSKIVPEAVVAADDACKALLSLMKSTSRIPWSVLLLLLAFTSGCLVVYDARIHGGFTASRTGRFLNDTGLLYCGQQVVATAARTGTSVFRWTAVNLPVYFSVTWGAVGPYLEYLWIVVWECLSVALYMSIYAWEKLTALWEQLEDEYPNATGTIVACSESLYNFLRFHTLSLWATSVYYSDLAIRWMLDNLLVGPLSPSNLSQNFSDVVRTAQEYILSVVTWAEEQAY